MKRAVVVIRQTRLHQEKAMARTVRVFVNGVEVDAIISYLVDDTVGTPAQRVTLEFYADVTIDNA